MNEDSDFDSIEDRATINFSACQNLEPHGICLVVSEGYQDTTEPPRDLVLLEAHGGHTAFRFVLDTDQAEALARLLLSTAKDVRHFAAGREDAKNIEDERDSFVEHLERASEIVQTWPEWKKKILGQLRFGE